MGRTAPPAPPVCTLGLWAACPSRLSPASARDDATRGAAAPPLRLPSPPFGFSLLPSFLYLENLPAKVPGVLALRMPPWPFPQDHQPELVPGLSFRKAPSLKKGAQSSPCHPQPLGRTRRCLPVLGASQRALGRMRPPPPTRRPSPRPPFPHRCPGRSRLGGLRPSTRPRALGTSTPVACGNSSS